VSSEDHGRGGMSGSFLEIFLGDSLCGKPKVFLQHVAAIAALWHKGAQAHVLFPLSTLHCYVLPSGGRGSQ
jgi:hypothetical protein